jgi:hypothetical protein
MRKLLETEEESVERRQSPGAMWLGNVLGFLGCAVIFWIGLRALAPAMATAWGISWIANTWIRVAIVLIAALAFSALLSRIEGTIWARYYVIIGYLLSLFLIIWIILRLLNYV